MRAAPQCVKPPAEPEGSRRTEETTMKPLAVLRHAVTYGALLGLAVATPALAEPAGAPPGVPPMLAGPAVGGEPRDPADRVTLREIEASNAEVRMAYRVLMEMWTRQFQQIGAAFQEPALLRYRGTVRTSC